MLVRNWAVGRALCMGLKLGTSVELLQDRLAIYTRLIAVSPLVSRNKSANWRL